MNLDFTRLEDGVYTLLITTNDQSFQITFILTTEGLGTRNGQIYLDRKVEILQDEKRSNCNKNRGIIVTKKQQIFVRIITIVRVNAT